MTRKDYSTIQRNLGFIEGFLLCLDDDRGALDRIIAINSILEKEVLTDDARGEVSCDCRNVVDTWIR